jgi:hypothetical protein
MELFRCKEGIWNTEPNGSLNILFKTLPVLTNINSTLMHAFYICPYEGIN